MIPFALFPTKSYHVCMDGQIIKNNNFRKIAENVKPDSKKRVVLSKIALSEDIIYHIYCNEIGQIILDPHISIPTSEVWLFNNPDAMAKVETGLKEAASGKISKIDLNKL